MNGIGDRLRALPERHGAATLTALALIVALGLGLRAYRVVEPLAEPGDDSRAYYALAKALYTEGSFGGPDFDDSSDWSPGAPLLYAASFYLTGGAREGTARIVEALLGTAAIVVCFLLARRLARRPGDRGGERDEDGPEGEEVAGPAGARRRPGLPDVAGLLAALGVAVYPPFIHSTGALMSEPPALFTLPAAVLAFLWASERERPWYAWLVPGALFGLTAMFRPEYLLVGIAFAVLAALRGVWSPFRPRRVGNGDHAGGWRPALLGATALLGAIVVVILPWTIRNQVVLDRTVPISTGGGKALFVGTFLPADGEYQRLKAILAERFEGLDLDPHSEALEAVDPTPLFDRVADRYPDLPRDEALGKVGRENFDRYFGEDPLGYLAMTARKVGRMWGSGVGEAMSSGPGRAVQIALVALGLAGLALLGARRRWLELAAVALPLALVTAVGAASLAAPRRNEVLMTLVFPLVALALTSAASAISSRREWSRARASSPPS